MGVSTITLYCLTVIDTAGLIILYTSTLRMHDAGVIVSGITISPLQVLPPEQPRYRSAGYCAEPCTKAVSIFNLNQTQI